MLGFTAFNPTNYLATWVIIVMRHLPKTNMMKRDEVIAVLMAHQEQLKNFRVKSLALFGSFAREEATPDSDVDLLVEFDSPVGLFTFMRLQRYLQTILDRSVDLGTPDSLMNYLKEAVLKEAVRAI